MYILSSGADIVCHSATTFEEVARYNTEFLPTHAPTVVDLSVSTDGNGCIIIPGNSYAQVLRFDKKFKLCQTLFNVTKPSCCAFMKNRPDQFGIGTLTGEIYIWDNMQDRVQMVFSDPKSPILALDFFMHDAHFAVGNQKGLISVFDERFVSQKTLALPDSLSLSNLCCHPIRRGYLGATSDNGDVMVWDVKYLDPKTCQFYAKLAHAAPCTDLAFSRVNQRLLATVGHDGIVSCYDMAKNEAVLTMMAQEPLLSLDINVDGKTIVVGDVLGSLTIFDLRTYSRPLHFLNHVHLQPVKKVSFWASRHYTDQIIVSDYMKEEMFQDDNEYRAIWHVLGTVDENMYPKFSTDKKVTMKCQDRQQPLLFISSKRDPWSTMPKTIKQMQERSRSHALKNQRHSTINPFDADDYGDDVNTLLRKPEYYQNVHTQHNDDQIGLNKSKALSTRSKLKMQYGIVIAVTSGILEDEKNISDTLKVKNTEANEDMISGTVKENKSEGKISASVSTPSSVENGSEASFSVGNDSEHYLSADNGSETDINIKIEVTPSTHDQEESRGVSNDIQSLVTWVASSVFGLSRPS